MPFIPRLKSLGFSGMVYKGENVFFDLRDSIFFILVAQKV
jgi:hypothetical protein